MNATASSKDVSAQWQRFAPYVGDIRGQVGRAAYGVISALEDNPEGFDYLSGVEVSDFSDLPDEFSRVRIPAGEYAVFDHCGHVSTIRGTWNAIRNRWLPQSGHRVPDAPVFFERYGEAFERHRSRRCRDLDTDREMSS